MATTTNYGWTTPDDTALVKDGASAIRTLGTAIDTTVFNNASAGIAKTIVDAKGDIIAATAADTVARLAVGANDTILTADSSTATGLKWAAPVTGGMTLINTGGTTLTGASVTISSIPDTYVNLFVVIRANKPATDGAYLMMRFNGDSAANRHFRTDWASQPSAQAFDSTLVEIASDADNATATGLVQLTFFDYANTSTYKYAIGSSFNNNITTPTQINVRTRQLFYNQTAAISSLQFFPDSGNFTSGTVFVYGVK